MNSQYYPQGRSPPPLQHPIPTHAHYQIPEPPSTPAQDSSYVRFTSPPSQPQQHLQPHQQPGGGGGHIRGGIPQPAYGTPQHPQSYGYSASPNGSGVLQQPNFGGPSTAPGAGAAGGFAVPNLGAFGVNDATAQMGMQLGKSAMAAGQDYVEKNFGVHMPVGILKHQFNVSNSYVLNKLRIVLFPWRHKPWSRKRGRQQEGSTGSEAYQPPRDDINSPDLYIPTMAFVTYVLTAAFIAGIDKRFHPEVLGVAASKAFAVLLMDVMFVKMGFYLLNIQGPVSMVELAAYGGYKFVGTVVTLLSGQILGKKFYWCVFLYCFCATGFFLLRSLRYVVIPDPNANVGNSTVTHAQRGWRVRFLFAVAVTQILYMAFLALM